MRNIFLLLSSLALWIVPAGAQCRYSFTSYTNAWMSSDTTTVYTFTNEYDYSGCNHSQYSISGTITSPSGRTATVSNTGLSVQVGLAVLGEAGTYTDYSSGTFWCPAANTFAGFGSGGPAFGVEFLNSYWTNPALDGVGDCTWQQSACLTPSKATCSTPVIYFYQPCPSFVKATHAVFIVGGSPVCVLGTAVAWPGPGICQ